MADYTFKARFIPLIRAKTKQQTIRRYRGGHENGLKGHAKPGGPVGLKTGPRFKPHYIGHATAVLVDHVVLNFTFDSRRLIGHMGEDFTVDSRDLDRFAVMDGFEDWADMREFWWAEHTAREFQGARIFWGDTFVGEVSPVP